MWTEFKFETMSEFEFETVSEFEFKIEFVMLYEYHLRRQFIDRFGWHRIHRMHFLIPNKEAEVATEIY